jgi:hypothetical protein
VRGGVAYEICLGFDDSSAQAALPDFMHERFAY